MPFDVDPPGEANRQPMFNAPWPVVALVGAIIGGFALQGLFADTAVLGWAFAPADLDRGRWVTLVTALFLHGSWAHALMNAGAVLAFGTPAARCFGPRPVGIAGLAVFYLACGVLANLGYAALHPGDTAPLVGASGAASGLMAAAAQVIAGGGRPGPILSRPVLGMATAWVAVNLIVAFTGIAPGAGDATVAWEAHLAGFAAGVVLFKPLLWVFARAGPGAA